MKAVGRFIVLDGPSGVGKTTVASRLCARLRDGGWAVHPTKEPSRTKLGDLARHGTDEYRGLTLACMVTADRYYHLEAEVRPAVAAGKVVVSDRYLATSLVLQRLDGVSPEFIWTINRYADRPDLVIILTGDPIRSRDRAAVRGIHSRFHRGGVEAGHIENELYGQVANELTAAAWPVHRHDVSDQTPDEVVSALWPQVLPLLP
ncbi:hypothetical protein GCM10027290_07290 [Micromonospora sonneratiae]|uniref:Thymidylate kinase n=1 Tax=Micromonospora sonneratiae TaxID=1184706 RepID=A0ABW3Y9H2_9ACTN